MSKCFVFIPFVWSGAEVQRGRDFIYFSWCRNVTKWLPKNSYFRGFFLHIKNSKNRKTMQVGDVYLYYIRHTYYTQYNKNMQRCASYRVLK